MVTRVELAMEPTVPAGITGQARWGAGAKFPLLALVPELVPEVAPDVEPLPVPEVAPLPLLVVLSVEPVGQLSPSTHTSSQQLHPTLQGQGRSPSGTVETQAALKSAAPNNRKKD